MTWFRTRPGIRGFVTGAAVVLMLVAVPAWALSCSNCVDSGDILDGQVKQGDIATNGVGAADIATNAVGASEIATGAVGAAEIATNAVGVAEHGVVPAARVCDASNPMQSIPHNTETAVTFSTEVFDNAGLFDPASPTRLRAPVAGIYQVHAAVQWESNNQGQREIYIRKDGTTIVAHDTVDVSSLTVVVEASALIRLPANAFIEVVVLQPSGGSVDLRPGIDCSLPVLEMLFVSK